MLTVRNNQEGKQTAADSGHNFGTFYGVVLPSILTMLGAIMFLRINYITGRAGILYSLIILAISLSIVMATALSISAETNPCAQQAAQMLGRLAGCKAHCTAILSDRDEQTLQSMGIDVTCDPEYLTTNLYYS